MKIIHFDVDADIAKYLDGTKVKKDVNNIKTCNAECITIKSSSNINENVLNKFPNLKLIVTRTVGTDHIDLEKCKLKEIAVYHIEDYGAYNIAEHTFALLLSGTRNVVQSFGEIKKGLFSYKKWLGIALKGKVFGIIGTGKIGLEVIKLAKAFGMKIVAFDVFENKEAEKKLGFKYVSFDRLLTSSDIISLHAPLLKTTKHIINNRAIKKMKKGVVLINTARGGLIDTQALIKNIKKFAFVGLDVIEEEGIFDSNNLLLKYSNIVITPHISFFSDDSIINIARKTQECVSNYRRSINIGRVV